MHIIIVGAGLAGLTASISLRRAGHNVTIYERSSLLSEVGAAINMPPNATRFLTAWGLSPSEWKFVHGRKITFLDPFTLESKFDALQDDAAGKIGGAPLWYCHRVDLHNALRWMATREDGPGTPVMIHLGQQVVSYDPAKPSITVEGRGEVHADLVVGADGVHSLAPAAVLGHQNVPVSPQHFNCCYRFLIPASALEEDEETRFWNKDRDGWIRLLPDNDTSRRVVIYPCRDNTIHNFIALFYDEKAKEECREDWLAGVDASEVLERFADFHPKALKIMSKATEVKRWPLLYRHPLPTWHRDRLTLVGDSAHPMLPHQAQGGAQGMEDGLALGVILHGATPTDLEKRLELYEKLRLPRASALQVLSNVGQDQSQLVREDLAKFMAADKLPTTPREIYQHNFGYDIVRESVKLMKDCYPDFELPADFFEHEVPGVPDQKL